MEIIGFRFFAIGKHTNPLAAAMLVLPKLLMFFPVLLRQPLAWSAAPVVLLPHRSSNSLHRPLPHPPPSASHPAPCLPPPAAPNSLYFNKHPPALAPDDILRPVQIYLVLPAAMLEKTLSTADMGALAVRASTTLMASSSDKSLAMAVTRAAPHPSSSTAD